MRRESKKSKGNLENARWGEKVRGKRRAILKMQHMASKENQEEDGE